MLKQNGPEKGRCQPRSSPSSSSQGWLFWACRRTLGETHPPGWRDFSCHGIAHWERWGNQPCSQQKPGHILTNSGAGPSSTLMSARKGTHKLCSPMSHGPQQPQPRGSWGLGGVRAPSITSQHHASGPGLRHTGMNWWEGRTTGLNHPHCDTGNSSSQYTTEVSLQVPKGEMERDQGTKSSQGHTSITTAAAVSCRFTIPLHCWYCGQKPGSVDLGWACPSASTQPRARHSTSILLPPHGDRQGPGELTLGKQRSLTLRKGGATGCSIAAGLALTWSVSLGC